MSIIEINAKMKVADLVNKDFHVLGMLERMGIEDNFGEHTVEEICALHGMNPGTFIMLYNTYLDSRYKPTERNLRDGDIEDVMNYLRLSHGYSLNTALKSLSDALSALLSPCSEIQKSVFWKFYSEYKEELNRHFYFEEMQVMPYVQSLLNGEQEQEFSIDSFDDEHSSINGKISDLKNLVMKSLPDECDGGQRMRTLYLICSLEYDLERHTCIEDDILVPMVRMLECRSYGAGKKKEIQEEKEELSEREKEILLCVAKGMLNKEIADKFNISIYTVISHRKNITRKIGIKTVAGLTVYALLNGLLDVNSVE